MALVLAYLHQQPDTGRNGNLLCLIEEEGQLDFSFLSIYESVITLEHQNRGTWEDMCQEAQHLGFYTQDWDFDHCLYLTPSHLDALPACCSDLSSSIIRLTQEDSRQLILAGLEYLPRHIGQDGLYSLRLVYPYDFYLLQFDPQQHGCFPVRLPFDFANLELDINQDYKITSLSNPNQYVLPADDQVEFAIYTCLRTLTAPLTPTGMIPAFTLQILPEELPDRLELWLNISAGISSAGDNRNSGRVPMSAPQFLSRRQHRQRELYHLISGRSDPQLQEDWSVLLASPAETKPAAPEDFLEAIRLKLYSLLQLWSGT